MAWRSGNDRTAAVESRQITAHVYCCTLVVTDRQYSVSQIRILIGKGIGAQLERDDKWTGACRWRGARRPASRRVDPFDMEGCAIARGHPSSRLFQPAFGSSIWPSRPLAKNPIEYDTRSSITWPPAMLSLPVIFFMRLFRGSYAKNEPAGNRAIAAALPARPNRDRKRLTGIERPTDSVRWKSEAADGLALHCACLRAITIVRAMPWSSSSHPCLPVM
jgi:hypothetical protein